MVRRRTILAAATGQAALAGCLTDGTDSGSEGEDASDWTPPEANGSASDVSGPSANIYFQRTNAADGDGLAVEVGVLKLGYADELRVSSPDCDLDVSLDVALDGAVRLADEEELADCGDQPTLTVTGVADGTAETIATHTVSRTEPGRVHGYDGNAGSQLAIPTGSVGSFPNGTVAFEMKPVIGATDVWIESPDCSIAIPLEADEWITTTLRPGEELSDCPDDATIWTVAMDEDGTSIVHRTVLDEQ